MIALLTNVHDLNKNTINKSLEMLNQYDLNESNKIDEIFYLKEEPIKFNDDFNQISINTNIISMDKDMNDIYDEITNIIKDLIKKKDFINVVVDTSFLGYILLEILIKKFDITDVFLFENGKLKKAHPCSCGSDYIGY